jgi:hypothetical protein
MTVSVRVLAGVVMTTAAVLVLTGCGPSTVSGDPSATTATGSSSADAAAFASLDACKLLTPQELQQNGARTQAEPLNEAGETGCDFKNATDVTGRSISLVKSPNTMASFVERADTFLYFNKNSVNGRQGFQLSASDKKSECSQFLVFASNLVSVGVTGDRSGDPCGDATKLAQLAEPRLPK